jgi:hypothetical protein
MRALWRLAQVPLPSKSVSNLEEIVSSWMIYKAADLSSNRLVNLIIQSVPLHCGLPNVLF